MIPASPRADFFSLGPFTVHIYSVVILCAGIAGLLVARAIARKRSIAATTVLDAALLAIVAGFIGARVWHVWNEWWWYKDHLYDIYKVWNGGLAFHGGFIVGSIASIIFCRIKRLSILSLFDVFAPAFALAQSIGRWGNYFNEELFGKPTTLPWRLAIHPEQRPLQYATNAAFHPLFLYESLLNAVVFIILFRLHKTKNPKRGLVTGWYLIGYGSIRFSLDFLRINQFGFGPLSIAQWVSIAMVGAGIGILLSIARKSHLMTAYGQA